MQRVSVGYQDGCLHPLWLSRVSMRLAVSFGASALWVPDHFMSFTPRSVWQPDITPAAKLVPSLDALFDPVQMLAVTATRIRRVDLGTSVTEAFRRHPMSLAQAFVTLDHLSKGRAILGIGNGIRENTEPYGLAYEHQLARLEEALVVIRALWSSGGEPVTRDGRFWPLRDAIFGLPLYKGRAPRLFVAAHYPRMLRLTGRYADGWLPGQKVSPAEYRVRLDIIRAAAADAGRSMQDFLADADAARRLRHESAPGAGARDEQPVLRRARPWGARRGVARAGSHAPARCGLPWVSSTSSRRASRRPSSTRPHAR